jgi:uncharacterized delta-60 repeat protein
VTWLAIGCLALALPVAATGAPGSYDRAFSHDGKVITSLPGSRNEGTDVALAAHGKVLVTVRAEIGPGAKRFTLVRYTRRGRLDKTFSHDGVARADLGGFAAANALAVQRDGRIVAAGSVFRSGTTYDFGVARFLPNGRLDKTFSGDGVRTVSFSEDPLYDTASAVSLAKRGRIVLAGYATPTAGNNDVGIARLKPRGGLDPAFSGDGKATLDLGAVGDATNGLAIQGDGKPVVTGATTNGGERRFATTRFRANGLPDAFGGAGTVITDFPDTAADDVDDAFAVGIQSNGRIVAAGYTGNGFGGPTKVAVARYLTDGTPDPAFDGDGLQTFDFVPQGDQAQDLAISGRKLFLAGVTATEGTRGNDILLLAVRRNGTLDPSFAAGGVRVTHLGTLNDFGQAVDASKRRVIVAGLAQDELAVVSYRR